MPRGGGKLNTFRKICDSVAVPIQTLKTRKTVTFPTHLPSDFTTHAAVRAVSVIKVVETNK